jgi:hypothetical protein
MSTTVPRRRGLIERLAAIEDGQLLRATFYVLLVACAGMLYIDFREREAQAAPVPGLTAPLQPVLPAFDPDGPVQGPGPRITSDIEALKQPLRIELDTGGVLRLSGSIDPGAGARFAAEIAARGEYVEAVALDSPGGAVAEAIAIGALIREKGLATSVAAGALCASSCPLIFAGGVERRATPGSAIGVHQIYAALPAGEKPLSLADAGGVMANAQRMTATVSRHLSAMGVDPEVWLHALETPPDRLYYLSPEELTRTRLVTRMAEEPRLARQ